jgi:hypothetical protein
VTLRRACARRGDGLGELFSDEVRAHAAVRLLRVLAGQLALRARPAALRVSVIERAMTRGKACGERGGGSGGEDGRRKAKAAQGRRNDARAALVGPGGRPTLNLAAATEVAGDVLHRVRDEPLALTRRRHCRIEFGLQAVVACQRASARRAPSRHARSDSPSSDDVRGVDTGGRGLCVNGAAPWAWLNFLRSYAADQHTQLMRHDARAPNRLLDTHLGRNRAIACVFGAAARGAATRPS